MSLYDGLVKVTFKSGKEGHVLPEEVPGLEKAGLLKEEKEATETKEEKSTGETKSISGHATRTKKGAITKGNIKGSSPKKT